MIAVLFAIIVKFFRVWFTCLFLVCLMEAKWIDVAHKQHIYCLLSWQTIELLLHPNAYFASEILCLICLTNMSYSSLFTLQNFTEISRGYFIYRKFDSYTFCDYLFRQSAFTQEPITSNLVIQSSSAIEVRLILG